MPSLNSRRTSLRRRRYSVNDNLIPPEAPNLTLVVSVAITLVMIIAINKLQPGYKVYRDSELIEIEAEFLVPGDRVFVKLGDMVPADCILSPGTISCDTDQNRKHLTVTLVFSQGVE